MHHPVQSRSDRNVHLPLRFAGGFGIDSDRIGLLFTVYGLFGMFVQFALFPPLARRFGVLWCLKACSLTFPLLYIATPFTSLLPTNALRQGIMMIVMLCKGWCAIFAFPCSTILFTNSAASLKILGRLNGVATSISAIGRAAGPALAGATFSAGVNIGYVVISWWTLAGVAALGAIPVFWLVEGEGFAADENEGETPEDELDDDEIGEATSSINQPRRRISIASAASEAVDDGDSAEATPFLARSAPKGSRRMSQENLSLDRVPSPIGMGVGVCPPGARRYSSDLGASRSGLGTGGTSYH